MKKITGLCCSLMLLANTFVAEANYTDDLRAKYSDKNIYIEYLVTVQDSASNGSGSKQPMQRQRPMRPGSKAEFEQTKSAVAAGSNGIVTGTIAEKVAYAQHGANIMLQRYFPEYYNDDFPEMGIRQYSYEMSKKNSVNNYTHQQTRERDYMIVKEGKIYFFDRKNLTGKWGPLENFGKTENTAKFMFVNFIDKPDPIRDVLVADSNNKQISFQKAGEKYIDGKKFIVETYTSQNISAMGQATGKPWNFDFYYDQNGALAYFSYMPDMEYLHIKIDYKRNLKPYIKPLLGQVLKITKVSDDAIFNIPNGYQLESFD